MVSSYIEFVDQVAEDDQMIAGAAALPSPLAPAVKPGLAKAAWPASEPHRRGKRPSDCCPQCCPNSVPPLLASPRQDAAGALFEAGGFRT